MSSGTTYSAQDVLDALRRMDGIHVLEQKARQIPKEFDYTGFDSEYPQQTPHVRSELEDLVEACQGYLSGIVITDDFSDHTRRREWRWEMHGRFGDAFSTLYSRNKLRINMLSWVHLGVHTTSEGLRIFKVRSPRAQAIRAVAVQLPEFGDYDKMPIEEKLKIVEKCDDICALCLDILGKK